MATTNKKPTTKKTSVSKKATVKSPKRLPRLTWRFYAVTIGIFLVAVTTVVVLAYLTAGMVAKQANKERLDRINGIYSSLEIDERYNLVKSDVFGDKRKYEDNKDRTIASKVEYIRADTVNNTVADLDMKIKGAGFTLIDEPYPDAASVQYYYKSVKGEYVRLTVYSKPYHDAIANSLTMNQDAKEAVKSMDKNAGPSVVIVRVNLDDNNE